MLAEAHARFETVRTAFAEASDVLGYDVWTLVSTGEQEALNLTETTQPVLLTCSVALWRAWNAAGGAAPDWLAGHSLGEFSALTCAGSLSFEDALRVVRERGRFMQSAVPVGEGAMAAIMGLEDEVLRRVCAEVADAAGAVVAPVNFNAPGQVVIAGHAAAVDAAVDALKAAGAKRAVPLAVSAPFHTSLMRPAGEKLKEVLAQVEINAPRIPVVHNVQARAESDPTRIRELLVEQIASPVLWTDCVRAIIGEGVSEFAECGPGNVLCGLNKRIDRSVSSHPLEAPDSLLGLIDAGHQRQSGEKA
jgi:[acyl-carrier-protein] S-malonyltransferase